MWDALAQAGVEIYDHTGEVVPDGGDYGLKVLARQPTPGVRREIVLETIRPSIRYQKRTIQMGEVVVAKPDTPSGADAVPDSSEEVDRASPEPREAPSP